MLNVVIVDDTEINVTLLRHLVAKLEDCASYCFTDPKQGLAWCQVQMPDLVLVDYMMPDLDGIEFIRRLRGTPGRENIPILMITANDEVKVRYDALTAGANDFLTKPVDRTEFIARSRNMLALRVSQKHLEDKASWLAEEVQKATAELVNRERETILRLSRAAEFRDPETGVHIQRMARYSCLIAAKMGLSPSDQELILNAAPMHDVGKVGIPDHILLKPGKLDQDEFEIMKTHTTMGGRILGGSSSKLLETAAQIALTHHEKFDGSGYPNGLIGEEIPLLGRIVAVADVFDALTSARPYKPAWSHERAVDLLREGAGSHFDPACVEVFLDNLDAVQEIQSRFKDEE